MASDAPLVLWDCIFPHAHEVRSTEERAEVPAEQQSIGIARGGPRVFDGGDLGRAKGNYMPVLQRERQESVEVVNEKYRVRRGIPDRIQAKDDDGDE